MSYLALLAIMKNETLNLKVWLDHYIWQGVNHFYIIDNDSSDNPLNILNEYIDKNIVTYDFLPEKYKQCSHYHFVFDKYHIRDKFRWLIICDLDEFFFGVKEPLYKVLQEYHEYDVIVGKWHMFGHQNIIEQPNDIRTAFTLRSPDLDNNQKIICNPQKIISSNNIGIHRIYQDLREIIVNDKIHLNHYPLQSYDFFIKIKMQRGDADSENNNGIRNLDYFNIYNSNCNFNDELLKNLVINNY